MDKRIKVKNDKKEIFPEHEFIASCLRIGLTLSDLKELTYIDVMKILLTFLPDETGNKASQKDIDKLLG